MAVSQRNFLPFAAVVIGLILFAVFGFGRSEEGQSSTPESKVNPTTSQRDEAEVDKVARLVAEEAVETGEAETPQQNPESERLNLSGQTVDDSFKAFVGR